MRHASVIAAFLLFSPARSQEILVSGFGSGEVHRYDFNTGAYLGPMALVHEPQGITHDAAGWVYIAVEGDDKIVRVDPATAPLTEDFVFDDPLTPVDESGGLNGPTGVVFGPDGNLYVASFASNQILRYDGTTGVFLGIFVAAGSGGLNGPDAGIAFGPDGHLYVPSHFNHRVLRYDGTTGAFLDAFIPASSGGLTNPRSIVFRSDGRVLVSSQGSDQVLRYRRGGTYERVMFGHQGVTGFALSPLDGNYYSTSVTRNNVRVAEGTTGASLGERVTPGVGGLDLPVFLAFHPDPYLHLQRLDPGQAGSVNTLRLRNATPGALQALLIGTSPGSLAYGPCAHLWFGVSSPTLVFAAADGQGKLQLSGPLGTDVAGVTVYLQAFEPVSCRVSGLVVQTL